MERTHPRFVNQQPEPSKIDDLALAYAEVFSGPRGQLVLDDINRKANSPALDTSKPDPNMAVGILYQQNLYRYVHRMIEQGRTPPKNRK